jgi:hypothetical protein
MRACRNTIAANGARQQRLSAVALLRRMGRGAKRDPIASMARLTLHFDVGPVVAARYFLMPFAAWVFPGNGAGSARYVLFLAHSLPPAPGRLMRWECFGKCAVDLIGPAAVVLDNAINDLGHGAGFLSAGYVSPEYVPVEK